MDLAPTPAPSRVCDVVLVRGCPRSGTTMVARLINANAQAGLLWEYSLGGLVRDLEPILRYGRGWMAERSENDRVYAAGDLGNAYVRPAAIRGATPRGMDAFPTSSRFPAIVEAVVATTLGKRELCVIGSKTPGSLAADDYPVLEPYFPVISSVYVVRDPLGTINSMINRRNLAAHGFDVWPYADVEAAMREYRASICALLSCVATRRCFVVKYEDATANLDAMRMALAGFLGIRRDDVDARWFPKDPAERGPARYVLTAGEEAAVRREFGAAIGSWAGKDVTGADAGARVEALADCLATFQPGRAYSYQGVVDRSFLGSGWSYIEPSGVWIEGERADMFFAVQDAGPFALSLDGMPFLPLPGSAVTLRIEANGREVLHATFSQDEQAGGGRRLGAQPEPLVCEPVELRPGSINSLTFRVEGITRPIDVGVSNDARRLSFLMRGCRLTAC